MDITQALTRYRASLVRRGCAETTVSDYAKFIGKFTEHLKEHQPEATRNVALITYSTLSQFLDNCQYKQGTRTLLAASTRAGQVNILRSFGKYLQRKEAIRFQEQDNPFLSLDRPAIHYEPPRAPEVEELVRILAGPNYLRRGGTNYSYNPGHPYREWMNERNKLILYTLCILGLRCAELRALQWQDIESGALRVKGKGKKVRIIPLPGGLSELFSSFRHIERGRGRGQDETNIFWAHQMGRENAIAAPIGETGVYLIVVDVLQDRVSGFKRIGPHMLRHAALTALVESGADLVTVADIAGHSSIELLRRHYVAPRDKRKAAALSASGMNRLLEG